MRSVLHDTLTLVLSQPDVHQHLVTLTGTVQIVSFLGPQVVMTMNYNSYHLKKGGSYIHCHDGLHVRSSTLSIKFLSQPPCFYHGCQCLVQELRQNEMWYASVRSLLEQCLLFEPNVDIY